MTTYVLKHRLDWGYIARWGWTVILAHAKAFPSREQAEWYILEHGLNDDVTVEAVEVR